MTKSDCTKDFGMPFMGRIPKKIEYLDQLCIPATNSLSCGLLDTDNKNALSPVLAL